MPARILALPFKVLIAQYISIYMHELNRQFYTFGGGIIQLAALDKPEKKKKKNLQKTLTESFLFIARAIYGTMGNDDDSYVIPRMLLDVCVKGGASCRFVSPFSLDYCCILHLYLQMRAINYRGRLHASFSK